MILKGLNLGASIYAFIVMNFLIHEPVIESVTMGLLVGVFGVLNMLFVFQEVSD